MTQAIAKLEQPKLSTPDANEFQVILKTSEMLVRTGFLPAAIKTPEQALAIILTGRELGIGTMAALNTINVIQGKPTVSPQLMLALIERSGQLENIEITVDAAGGVQCVMKRKGRTAHAEYFGKDEAAAMQLAGKDNYKKQAQTMYRWRAVAACARVVFPDVILGLYTPDEMGADVNPDGEVIEPPKDNIRSLPTPEPEAAEEVPNEHKRSAGLLCAELNKAGDSIKWDKQTTAEYTADLFGFETPDLDQLTDEQWQFFAEDLQQRLDALR
jgi:hypothetical protein